MLDSSGNDPDTILADVLTTINSNQISASTHFLPSSLRNHSSLSAGIMYDISLGVTSLGSITMTSNDGGFAIKDTIYDDLVNNTNFMGVLASNNSNKTSADSTSLTYSITNTVVGFNSDKTASVSDSSNNTFTVSLSTSQEELLTSDVSGSVTFVKDDIDSRATRTGDANIFNGLNVYFGDEATGGSGSVDASGMNLKDVSYNISLVMPDVSNSNFNVASNVITNGFSSTGNNNVVVLKDDQIH